MSEYGFTVKTGDIHFADMRQEIKTRLRISRPAFTRQQSVQFFFQCMQV